MIDPVLTAADKLLQSSVFQATLCHIYSSCQISLSTKWAHEQHTAVWCSSQGLTWPFTTSVSYLSLEVERREQRHLQQRTNTEEFKKQREKKSGGKDWCVNLWRVIEHFTLTVQFVFTESSLFHLFHLQWFEASARFIPGWQPLVWTSGLYVGWACPAAAQRRLTRTAEFNSKWNILERLLVLTVLSPKWMGEGCETKNGLQCLCLALGSNYLGWLLCISTCVPVCVCAPLCVCTVTLLWVVVGPCCVHWQHSAVMMRNRMINSGNRRLHICLVLMLFQGCALLTNWVPQSLKWSLCDSSFDLVIIFVPGWFDYIYVENPFYYLDGAFIIYSWWLLAYKK